MGVNLTRAWLIFLMTVTLHPLSTGTLEDSAAWAQQSPPTSIAPDIYDRLVDKEMRRNMEVQNRTQTDVERSWAGYWDRWNAPYPLPLYSPWPAFDPCPSGSCDDSRKNHNRKHK